MGTKETAEALSAKIVEFTLCAARDPKYAANHPLEAGVAATAALLLFVTQPGLANLSKTEAAKKVQAMGSKFLFGRPMTSALSDAQLGASLGPGARDMYNQLLKDDPKQARTFLIQEMMASLKLMGEILSNVSKTRSEISQTFARNARA